MTDAGEGTPGTASTVDVRAAYAQLDGVEPTFLRDVAVALVVSGHDLELDVDLATVDVDAADPWVGRVLGVVRPIARSVSFYAVHPTPVPPPLLPQAVELAMRATDAEFDVAFEVDLTSGTFAARSSVSLGDVEISVDVLGGLLGTALDAAESRLLRYRAAIEAVAAGETSPADAAASARGADLDALAAELSTLDARLSPPSS
ncbi:hypothetical protein [Pseudactinotalea suaedae]|uniref:hypothetical protein n=1 Tax=Pseudactinotalea suaedae TaxID=1524924 RepID=UPI0012E2AB41|nr:hypothetical protein [Pseudactinotalea suaedae]